MIVECGSISLSRLTPALLVAVTRPLIDSTARESMHRTLGSMRYRMALSQVGRGLSALTGEIFHRGEIQPCGGAVANILRTPIKMENSHDVFEAKEVARIGIVNRVSV